jgi:hypothetical protein
MIMEETTDFSKVFMLIMLRILINLATIRVDVIDNTGWTERLRMMTGQKIW